MAISRRELIVTGSGGAFMLALSGCASKPAIVADGYRFLTSTDRALARALTLAYLGDAVRPEQQRDAAVHGFDVAIAGLPPAVRAEVRQLFDLLNLGPARGVTTGIWQAWDAAPEASVTAFLTNWRTSSTMLFRSGYAAMHALINGGWYGQTVAWAATGYPGPPVVA